MTLVVLDVETTGMGHKHLPPREDAIVQIGMAWREAMGQPVQTWMQYARPDPRFFKEGRADKAIAIHGISEQMLADQPALDAAAASFWQKIWSLEKSGQMVEFRAFNKSFDAPFLQKPPWSVPVHRFGPCIMLAAERHLNYYKWPTLSEAMELFGVPWPQGKAHDAQTDAHAALLVLEAMQTTQTTPALPG